ncbi:MAG TPA: MFS transporter [Longimicrobiales bacterium]|nr:MFS transporter [Longimicrobiales bacterium]
MSPASRQQQSTVPRLRTLLRGNVLWLSIVSLLNDTASEMIYPLLPLFLTTTLGAGAAVLGLIEGIAETTSSFVKLVGGWISDRVHRRKLLIAWGYGIAVVVRPLIALASAPWHVLAIRFGDRIGKGIRTAPRDALLAGSVDPDRSGAAFGLHRAADHLGAVLGPLIATLLLLLLPGHLRLIFALAAIPGAGVVVVVLLKVREVVAGDGSGATSADGEAPAPSHHPASGTGGGEAGEPAHAANQAEAASAGGRRSSVVDQEGPGVGDAAEPGFRDLGKGYAAYLVVVGLFTLGNASDAFLLLRARQLGIAVAWIPTLWGVHHVSKMAWNVVGGTLSDRFGSLRAIIAGWVVYTLTYVGFAFAAAAWHVWALFIVYGLFYGLTEAPEKALVSRLAPPVLRARAFGAYHFAIGLTALPASILFGVLWQAFSPEVAFLFGGGLALVAAALLAPAVRRAQLDAARAAGTASGA